MPKKEIGAWIPYAIGAVAMVIYWPFAIGFFLTSQLIRLTDDSRWQTVIAVAAVAVGIWFLILAKNYLGYDLHGMMTGDE